VKDIRVMIRRWGAKGQKRTLDIGGLPADALIAVVDEMRDGLVRVIDLHACHDYWAPLEYATKLGSRKANHADTAEGLEHARMMLGPTVTLSGNLKGCSEAAQAKGESDAR
jgi:hypothetical protein